MSERQTDGRQTWGGRDRARGGPWPVYITMRGVTTLRKNGCVGYALGNVASITIELARPPVCRLSDARSALMSRPPCRSSSKPLHSIRHTSKLSSSGNQSRRRAPRDPGRASSASVSARNSAMMRRTPCCTSHGGGLSSAFLAPVAATSGSSSVRSTVAAALSEDAPPPVRRRLAGGGASRRASPSSSSDVCVKSIALITATGAPPLPCGAESFPPQCPGSCGVPLRCGGEGSPGGAEGLSL